MSLREPSTVMEDGSHQTSPPPAPDVFRTRRLFAERPQHGDLEELTAFHRDAEMPGWLTGPVPETQIEDETREFLSAAIEHWELYGFGIWLLRDVEDHLLGRAGLWHITVERVDEVELTYALRAEVWGRGLATEIGRALLDMAFRRFHLRSVVAFVPPDDQRTRRVIEKLGMRLQGEVLRREHAHMLYRVNADEWGFSPGSAGRRTGAEGS